MSRPQKVFRTEASVRLDALVRKLEVPIAVIARWLGDETGAGRQRIYRYLNGTGGLPDRAVEMIEDGLKRIEAGEPLDTPRGKQAADAVPFEDEARSIEELAGDYSPDDRDPTRTLARASRRLALGVLRKIALRGKSEAARVKAAQVLLDRADGRVLPGTEPDDSFDSQENERLLEMLARMRADKLSREVAKTESPAELLRIEGEAAALPDHHSKRVLDAVEARRKAIGAPLAE